MSERPCVRACCEQERCHAYLRRKRLNIGRSGRSQTLQIVCLRCGFPIETLCNHRVFGTPACTRGRFEERFPVPAVKISDQAACHWIVDSTIPQNERFDTVGMLNCVAHRRMAEVCCAKEHEPFYSDTVNDGLDVAIVSLDGMGVRKTSG